MANIRTETTRHDYTPQKVFQPDAPGADEKGYVMGQVCRNCDATYVEGVRWPPPVAGCVSDVKMRLLGKSRQHDLDEKRGAFD